MTTQSIRIAMNGVTGRMGKHQHLARSIMAIRNDGGIALSNGTTLVPEPVLIGRDSSKLAEISREHGNIPFTTDLDSALSDSSVDVYFDAQTTPQRFAAVSKAIAAGKHVYCEKPCASDLAQAMQLFHAAEAAGVKHGVVQDKLWLPGILSLKNLIDNGSLGRVLSVRGEFGYWVFTGEDQPAQRPSWNYRKEDGGGIIIDMLCHWRYLIDNLFGEVRNVTCLGATHIPERIDESGNRYTCTADDAAYATFETARDIICHFNSSWCVRVRRDDLLTLQVDGTKGSAVAGLRECRFQSADRTPRPVWNPDVANPLNFYDDWALVQPTQTQNAFRAQWELFLRHVVEDTPFRWNLLEGAKGIQLAEIAMRSWSERRWLNVPTLG